MLVSSFNRCFSNKIKLIRLNFPTDLEFEPMQVCNAKCFCCPYTLLSKKSDYTKKRMSRTQIEGILISFKNNLLRYNYHGVATIYPYRYSDPLIFPDLDLVLNYSSENNLKVQITTNAVGFNSRTIALLEKFLPVLKDNIFISIIGSSEEEVQKNMDISLNHTIQKIRDLCADKSPLISKLKISLRVVNGSDDEKIRLFQLQNTFRSFGVRTQIKMDWMQNRISGLYHQQSCVSHIVGCSLYHNKLLRQLQVRVNGDVVLCGDDAEGKKIFGNIFHQSIDEIWNGNLKEEHKIIFSPTFDAKKNDLLCANCSRAQYQKRKYSLVDTAFDLGRLSFYKSLWKRDFTYIG